MTPQAFEKNNIPMKSNTFLIRVQFSQNATWQGTVQWIDRKKKQHFPSLLELMLLIHEALKKSEENITYDTEFRSWHDKEEPL